MRISLILCLMLFSLSGNCQENNPSNYNFNSGQQPKAVPLPQYQDTLTNFRDTLDPKLKRDLTKSYSAPGSIDSLKMELLKMRQEITFLRTDLYNVQSNLSLSHNKFRIGAVLLGLGVAGFFIGSISASYHTYATESETFLILGGLGATVTGVVFMINSHKYIGKAGTNVRRYIRTVRP